MSYESFLNDSAVVIKSLNAGGLRAISDVVSLSENYSEFLKDTSDIAGTVREVIVSTSRAFGIYLPGSTKHWKTARFFARCSNESEAYAKILALFPAYASFFPISTMRNHINPEAHAKAREASEAKRRVKEESRVYCDDVAPESSPKEETVSGVSLPVSGDSVVSCPMCTSHLERIAALETSYLLRMADIAERDDTIASLKAEVSRLNALLRKANSRK